MKDPYFEEFDRQLQADRDAKRASAAAAASSPTSPAVDEQPAVPLNDDSPEESGVTTRKRRRPAAGGVDFTGPLQPLQVRLPADLVSSLKLLSFDKGETISELVFRALTSPESIPRVWLSKRAG